MILAAAVGFGSFLADIIRNSVLCIAGGWEHVLYADILLFITLERS